MEETVDHFKNYLAQLQDELAKKSPQTAAELGASFNTKAVRFNFEVNLAIQLI